MDTPSRDEELLTQRTFTAEQWERRRLFLLTPAGRKAEEELLRRISRDQVLYERATLDQGYERNRRWDERQLFLHSPEGKAQWAAEQQLGAARRSALEHLDVLEREAKAAADREITEQFQERRKLLAEQWLREDARERR